MSKYVAYEDDTIRLVLENHMDGLILHVDSLQWSKSVYSKYIDIFAELLDGLKQVGVRVLYAPIMDEKVEKFATMFGFVPSKFSVGWSDGVQRNLLMYKIED